MGIYRNFDIEIEESELWRLLGYNESLPDDEILEEARREIKLFREYLDPVVTYKKINIKSIENDRVILENSVSLSGEYAAYKLEGCKYVIITIATLGEKIDGIIQEAFSNGDYLKGMIIDNIGSIAIEYINKKFWNMMVSQIDGGSMGITSRLSPGTGGWDISAQQAIFKCMDSKEAGVVLTDSNMMLPLKSTSIVYGFGEGIGIAMSGHICSECNMKNCEYRMDRKVDLVVHTPHNEDKIFHVDIGTNLLDALRREKIMAQSTCGGNGTCGKCRVQFLKGAGAPRDGDKRHLTKEELEKGIRLACSYKVYHPCEIVIPDIPEGMNIMTESYDVDMALDPPAVKKYMDLSEPTIEDQRGDLKRLEDGAGRGKLDAGTFVLRKLPGVLREGDFKVTAAMYKDILLDIEIGNTSKDTCGIAVDIGTTTIACYLVSLHSGKVMDIESDVNRQRAYGGDVISRINYTIEDPDGISILQESVVLQINDMVLKLCERNSIKEKNIYNMAVAGNTTMIHLLLGLPCRNIALSPYIPVTAGPLDIRAEELGIKVNGYVSILPGLASYVGSDITSGILSCGMASSDKHSLLLDLGTNGEIALGNRDRIISCSVAAGPAFEGANIKCGIGGVRGAISKVDLSRGKIYETIGNRKPCGICGSGVLDAVSEFIRYGIIDDTGRMLDKDELDCPAPLKNRISSEGTVKQFTIDRENQIVFTQKDVREVQLAKAAVCAGIELLLKERGVKACDVEKIYIAGGFGNYMSVESAFNIGLLTREFEGRVKSIGNSAGTGAMMYLLSTSARLQIEELVNKTGYIELSTRQDFQDYFVNSMCFGG